MMELCNWRVLPRLCRLTIGFNLISSGSTDPLPCAHEQTRNSQITNSRAPPSVAHGGMLEKQKAAVDLETKRAEQAKKDLDK